MKWNRKNIARRARIELRNGEKAIREQLETLREKADREIDRESATVFILLWLILRYYRE